jgi:hypothetical protein
MITTILIGLGVIGSFCVIVVIGAALLVAYEDQRTQFYDRDEK